MVKGYFSRELFVFPQFTRRIFYSIRTNLVSTGLDVCKISRAKKNQSFSGFSAFSRFTVQISLFTTQKNDADE